MLVLLVVASAAQKTPINRTLEFHWGAGEPQELDKALTEYKDIGAEDRSALLHAFAREFSDDPTPPSPMERAEQTRVKFIDDSRVY
jgi:hypothetical protein